MAKHTIRILNYNLTLTSDDDKSYIDSVAQRVERNIKTLSDNMPTRNMTEVALFVAMDYCDRYMKAIGDGTSMRGQIKDYLKDAGFARQQLEEAKKENERLREENEKLRSRITQGREEQDPDDDYNPVSASAPLLSDDLPEQRSEPEPAPAAPSAPAPAERLSAFSRKKAGKKKKGNKTETPPVRGFFSRDDDSESADAAADIMSFFEEKSFEDDE